MWMKMCGYLFQTSIKTYFHCFAGTVLQLWKLIMKRFINREPEKKYNDKRTSASLAANPTTTGCPAPFDAAQAPTIYVLPQPPLIYKMNANHYQADSLDESYQQNSTQTDLVIKECLTQPDQPKQSSLVHPDQFSQGKNVQTGQLSSNSAPEQPQQPSSGQPPSLGQPSPSSGQPPPYSSQPPPYVGQPSQYLGQPGAYQPYYGPYYGAPPGVYHYPGHYPTQAPVPSAAGKKITILFCVVKQINTVR